MVIEQALGTGYGHPDEWRWTRAGEITAALAAAAFIEGMGA